MIYPNRYFLNLNVKYDLEPAERVKTFLCDLNYPSMTFLDPHNHNKV